MKFTKETLNQMMDDIVVSYFSDETVEYGLGLMDVIEDVKVNYESEIKTLGGITNEDK